MSVRSIHRGNIEWREAFRQEYLWLERCVGFWSKEKPAYLEQGSVCYDTDGTLCEVTSIQSVKPNSLACKETLYIVSLVVKERPFE